MRMSRFLISSLLLPVLLGACQTAAVGPSAGPAHTCRFLLTYDDGPSARRDYNPTLDILRQLESNDVQPHIKALFFVQTRNKNGGGDEYGQAVLRYQHENGHVLGLHSGTQRGHIRHTQMPPGELEASLRDGRNDLRAITGEAPAFIRPTFWGYNDQTLDLYTLNDLKMLLTDVNNRDGTRFHNIFGFRQRLRAELLRTRRAVERGALPQYLGHTPVIVTFHDLNTITAANMAGYLRILVEEATAVGLPLADKPFYDDAREIAGAAALRTVSPKPATAVARKPAPQGDTAAAETAWVANVERQVESSKPVLINFSAAEPAPILR